jgi:hypothetical protein
MALEHRQHEERHDVISEIARQVADPEPSLRVACIAKARSRRMRGLEPLAEGSMPGEKLFIGDAIRAEQRE